MKGPRRISAVVENGLLHRAALISPYGNMVRFQRSDAITRYIHRAGARKGGDVLLGPSWRFTFLAPSGNTHLHPDERGLVREQTVWMYNKEKP